MQLNFDVDAETLAVINKFIVKYLQKYFYYNPEQAYKAVNNYYRAFNFKNTHPDTYDQTEELDTLFHHDHPYIVAERIFFENNGELKSQFNNVVEWQFSKGGIQVPTDAEKDWRIWSAED